MVLSITCPFSANELGGGRLRGKRPGVLRANRELLAQRRI
jgi:hypothetical protein